MAYISVKTEIYEIHITQKAPMSSNLLLVKCAPKAGETAGPGNDPTHSVKAYYETTATVYSVWSKDLNMHFGYWVWGANPFNREVQLQNLTKVVLKRLKIEPNSLAKVGDFGCGYGAAARLLAQTQPNATVRAITIVPSQVRVGRLLNEIAGLDQRVLMTEADYTSTNLPANFLDASYAIESACHAAGKDKLALLTEMVRTLKPGATLVIADGFRTAKPLPAWLQGAYRRFCDGWALPEMVHLVPVKARLSELGCQDITFTDISWRVAPSVAHIPWVASLHTIRQLWRGKGKLEPWRKKHIEASVLTMLLGLALPWFRYGILTAKKNDWPEDTLLSQSTANAYES
jgi:cyclopropane fatty-acyl-phospholipid synthase-like methyltransferase